VSVSVLCVWNDPADCPLHSSGLWCMSRCALVIIFPYKSSLLEGLFFRFFGM
jgi:hypothetical protein